MLRGRDPRLFTQCRRCLHTQLSTIYSPTPSFLTSHLSNLPPTALTLYLLSTTLPHLPALSSVLRDLPNSVGSFHTTPNEPSIALASFIPDAPGEVKLFRSELVGRPPVEVGRWQRPSTQRGPDDERGRGGELVQELSEGGWDAVWEERQGSERIPELEGFDAQSVLVLSDSQPGRTLSALDLMYPHAPKLGLLSAPTPFITGRPHTLLLNQGIHDSGAVGLAFASSASASLNVDFGVEPLSEPLTIVSAKGNMLLSVSGPTPNPTQTLIGLIQRRGGTGITKDQDFYLAFLPATDGSHAPSRIVKILSGDPSRGALSLDTTSSLRAGQRVRFMLPREATSPTPETEDGVVSFGVVPTDEAPERADARRAHAPRAVPGFMGMSEAGFAHSTGIGSSVCAVPFAHAGLHFR